MITKLSYTLDRPSTCACGMARVPGKVSTPTSKASPSLRCLKFLLQKLFLWVKHWPELSFPEFSLSLSQSPKWFFYYFFLISKVTHLSYKKENLKTYKRCPIFPSNCGWDSECLSIPQYPFLLDFILFLWQDSGRQCVFQNKKQNLHFLDFLEARCDYVTRFWQWYKWKCFV